jgi:hypothetical protein
MADQLARAHYEQFLRRYDMPTAMHRHLVEEARGALARLGGKPLLPGQD